MQHINDLSNHIDLSSTLSKAEGIYCQLMSAEDQLPDNVRVVIGLEVQNNVLPIIDIENDIEASDHNAEADESDTNAEKNSSTESILGFDTVTFDVKRFK